MKKKYTISKLSFLPVIRRINSYIAGNSKSFRKRISVYLVFVLLATVLWFYRALDDTYVADIKFPAEFINFPANKILITQPPKKIILKVRGNGYTILNNIINPSDLPFDVNNFALINPSNDSILSLRLVTRNARESIRQYLDEENNELEIISISPDTINFNFAKTKSARLPVKPQFSHPGELFARQYIANGPFIIIPDTAIVIGPANIIDTLSCIYTNPIDLILLEDSATVKSVLQIPNDTKSSVNSVTVTIPVDQFTETNFEVEILKKHEPDSINLVLFPKTVKVNYQVTHSYYSKITPSDFRPYVDFYNIDTSNTLRNPKLKIFLDSLPQQVHNVTVYPTMVDYLIEIRNAESWLNGRNR